jgi:hypothetical protein
LSVGVYAKGSSSPALKLSVTEISFGSVPASTVDISPPAGAKVVDLGTIGGRSGGDTSKPKTVTGLDAVRAAAGFDVVAPEAVAGRQRTEILLVGGKHCLWYAAGPSAIVIAGTGRLDAVERRDGVAAPVSSVLGHGHSSSAR